MAGLNKWMILLYVVATAVASDARRIPVRLNITELLSQNFILHSELCHIKGLAKWPETSQAGCFGIGTTQR